jgi:hypothetical protein
MATRIRRIRRIKADLSVTIRLIRTIRVAITNLNPEQLQMIYRSFVIQLTSQPDMIRTPIFTLCFLTATTAFSQTGRRDTTKPVNKDTLVSTKQLDEVVVKSRSQIVEAGAAPGTIVYQVAKSADAVGLTGLEILKKSPGVSIDNNTTISLNGRTGVTIMIDGKLTYLSGKEVIDLLQSMPSSSIRSIELIASPGAKYDASGTAGIIHIRTIKLQGKGLNGNVNAGISYGITARQNTDLSLNYRKNRFNYLFSYNHFIGDYTYDYGTDRYQGNRYYSGSTYDRDHRKRFNTRAGVDYSLNEEQNIGVMVSANFIPGGGKTETHTVISGLNTTATEQVLDAVNDYYLQSTERYNYNLYYQYAAKNGRQLSIDADYGFFSKSNSNLQSNIYSDPSMVMLGKNLYRTLNQIDIRLYAFKTDYTTNFLQGKLETGMKYAAVSSVNDGRFYHVISHDSLDNRRSNRFAFKESITSAYLSYNKAFGKWAVQAGVRMEHTVNNSDTVRKSYTNFFPSTSISYQYKPRETVSLSYSRRIDRPAYPDLNPFVYLLDELSFWQGNPYLQPQLTHRLLLQWVYRNTTVVGLSYANTSSYIGRINDTIGVNKVVMIPRNIGRQSSFALTLSQNVRATQWWDMTLNTTVSYLHNQISYASYKGFEAKQLAARFNLVQRFQISPSFVTEITGIYQSSRLTAGNERNHPTSQVDIAAVKNINSQLTMRLSLSDLYKGSRLVTEQDMGGYYIRNYSYYETQQLKLNISYRFAEKNNKALKSRVSALDAENSRVK